MAEPSKQVVGYARVSVDAPDKVSPEMQAEAIEAQCKLKGWELVDLIVERGRSAGEGKKRPGLDRARKLIRTGKAAGLVVWKIDRCSRSVRDFAEILAELREHDADFVSVTESFDTSNAMGRAMLQITMVFAELERARMGERAAAWQAYRAKQGGTPTTRAILGYRRVDGQLLLDEQTAPIVKQAVEIFLATGSLSAAAGFLRDAGHPKWLSAARSLLSSPTLAGGRSVDGVFVAGGWPALIDMATHEAVLAIFADPRRVNKGRSASWKSRGTYRLVLFTDGGTTWRLIFKDEYYCPELIPAMKGLPASPGPPEALIYRLQSPFLSPFLPQLFWFREIEPGRRFQYLLEDLTGTCGELHLGKLPHIRAVRNLRRIQEVLGETFKGEHPDGLIRYDRRYSERLLDYAAVSLAEYAAQTREDAVATLRARWRDVVSVHQREEFYENGLRVPIHGDFNRSNIHVHRDKDAELKVVDWEWAGIGLPHADLAALVKSVYREDHPALLRAFVEGDRRFDPEQHQRLFHWCQLERRLLDAAFLAKQQLSSSRRVAWLQPDIKQAAGDVLAQVEWLNAAACSGGA